MLKFTIELNNSKLKNIDKKDISYITGSNLKGLMRSYWLNSFKSKTNQIHKPNIFEINKLISSIENNKFKLIKNVIIDKQIKEFLK